MTAEEFNQEQFDKDLAEKGEPIEREFLEIVKAEFDTEAYKIEGYCKEWDLVAPNINKTYEVKNNNDAYKCFCVELSCAGKPSGIVTSRADYWVYLAKDTFFVIARSKVSDLIFGKEVKKFTLYEQEVEMVNLDIVDVEVNSEFKFKREKNEKCDDD